MLSNTIGQSLLRLPHDLYTLSFLFGLVKLVFEIGVTPTKSQLIGSQCDLLGSSCLYRQGGYSSSPREYRVELMANLIERKNAMMIKNLLSNKMNNNKTAIKCKDETISFRQWHNASYHLSGLIKRHLNEGDKVIIIFGNNIQYCISYFAVLYANCVVAPCYRDLTVYEIRKIVKDIDAKMIITDHDNCRYLSEQTDINCIITTFEMNIIYYNPPSIPEYNSNGDTHNSLAVILQSSGTSGQHKYVMLSNENIFSNVNAHCDSIDILDNDIGLIILPMSFSYAHTSQFLSYLHAGITSILNDNAYFPSIFKKIVIDNDITITNITPAILNNIFNDVNGAETIDKLRHICIGAAKLNTGLWTKAIEEIKKCNIYSTYGITEASPRLTTLPAKDFKRKIGSVGLPIIGVKIKIIPSGDDDNQIVGEICVSGNNIMLGYYGQSHSPINNGYLYTGDVGYIDSEGYLFIIGRKKNIIIKNGLNINPEEIENVLEQYPGIRCAFVFAQKDDCCGEVPIAHIEADIPIQDFDIKQFCAKQLAEYKIPDHIIVVDKIKRTLSGKIMRNSI